LRAMTTKTEYAPGTPSWVDLATTDPAAAKAFYGALFGWTFEDQPTDDTANPYTLASLNGQNAAGVMTQTPEMRDAGAPSMWSTYVTVTDADATTAKVEAAGGSVFAPPFDVMDAGRMSVIADPTGAVICTWQPKNHPGAAVVNEPGAFSWNELLTPDVERAAAFYKELFGWNHRTQSMGPMTYTEFLLGEQSIAGAQPPPMEGIPPVWTVYFTVANTDATLADAKSRGANVLVEATDIPPGRFAVLTDPQGAAFNIIQPPA
jgi:predicted enzyme related to lactoylglutathione lyase